MQRKDLDPENLALGEDWQGNNAAFTCPECSNVFIVSGMMHRNGRDCPNCGKVRGVVEGGRKSGGSAYIEYLP